MSQNIYDTPTFFTNYANLPRSRHGPDGGAPEWARLQTLIPKQISDTAKALDLGCGFGWYSRWLVDQRGFLSVTGIDLSENMLNRAREITDPAKYPDITFQQADLDDPASPVLSGIESNSTELVLSVLCLHYLVNMKDLVTQVHRVLKPGGSFVVSIEHPIRTAPTEQRVIEIPISRTTGSYISQPGGKGAENTAPKRRIWPLDNYQVQGVRQRNWLTDGVRIQHRTVATYINTFLEAGFELTGFNEWCPTEEELEEHPEWVEECKNEMIKPTFLLMSVKKRT
ncbi:putative methyltransferase [Rhypophila decipiens]|uniref:Methyltransferase n=1 Tax=Rhypophila decipiens TaxID=261697 RepID=A0AAN6XZE9_9PEZI|nr:putative methyltransferase [Rhypophila decipiens]